MLISITIENFRSFNKPQTLSLLSTPKTEYDDPEINAVKIHEKLPSIRKSAVIFGANGSGKSSILIAMQRLTTMIQNGGIPNFLDNLVAIPVSFFHAIEPSKVSVRFFIEDTVFNYTVAFGSLTINFESLSFHDIKSGSDEVIFERSLQYQPMVYEDQPMVYDRKFPEQYRNKLLNVEQMSTDKGLTAINYILSFISDKQLWITGFANTSSNTNNLCRKICNFFNKIDTAIEPYVPNSAIYGKNQKLIIWSLKKYGFGPGRLGANGDKNILLDAVNLVSGGNISDIIENQQGLIECKYQVNDKDYNLVLEEQSDGTHKFMLYFARVNHAIENNGIIILDEPDNYLHYLIIEEIIKAIHRANSRAQLIFTTQTTNLLNHSLFERDQINFVEKDRQTQSSKLYSLRTIKMEKDDYARIAQDYLLGCYGAIPYFHDLNFSTESKR